MIQKSGNKSISIENYRALHEKTPNFQETTSSLEDKVLKEFNQKYAIVRTSSTYILVQKTDNEFELDSRKSFLDFHENDFFLTSDGKRKNKGIFWLKHPERRTYDNIIFDPTRPGDSDEAYNIFRGFAVIPTKGNCSLFWQHVKEVICRNIEIHYLYVRKWMACVIQKPGLLATALVLRGLQGTGKNLFVDYFGKIFGPYFLTASNLEHVCGKFNGHLKYAYLIHANEAVWGGSKKEIGAIKTLITDAVILLEGKGRDAIPVGNCRHLIVSSNEDWAVPMDLDDRRCFVLDVSSHRKGDWDYFGALHKEMSSGGVASLLYELLHEEISNFDPRQMPVNDSGFDIKMKSAGSIENFLYEILKEEGISLPGRRRITWRDCSCEEFYNCYREWCKKESLRIEPSSEFGKRMKKLLSIEKCRKSIDGLREWWYELPSLEQGRAAFERFTRQTNRIWGE